LTGRGRHVGPEQRRRPSADIRIGSLGCTTPILPSWPSWPDTVPSPAIVTLVSVGGSLIGWPALSSTAFAGHVGQRAVGHRSEPPIAGQPRPVRRRDG